MTSVMPLRCTTAALWQENRMVLLPGAAASVCLRKATTIASSPGDRTVERGAFGPMGTSLTKARFAPLGDCLVVQPILCRKLFERSLRSLYRSSDGVRGRGAAMKYLAHSASRNAGSVCLIPSHSGTEHLVSGEGDFSQILSLSYWENAGQDAATGPGDPQAQSSPRLLFCSGLRRHVCARLDGLAMVRKSLMLRGAPEGQPLRSARFARSAKGIPSLRGPTIWIALAQKNASYCLIARRLRLWAGLGDVSLVHRPTNSTLSKSSSDVTRRKIKYIQSPLLQCAYLGDTA